jgi:hypothetical protein
MNRNDALALLKKYLKNQNLLKHCLACEAIMKDLAPGYNQDPEEWALVGLLHDIDYEITKDCPESHGIEGARILSEAGLSDNVIAALRSHNPATGQVPNSVLEKALYAVDPVSGFIVACALIHPNRTLSGLDLDFLFNRFKEKSFARGADRNQIQTCNDLQLNLNDFLLIALHAMQKISPQLGL